MRKLATVRKIDEIRPIEGADTIECAVVGGWTVVIRKGEYQIGDLAVYCEIDSWIPTELAPFLSKGQEPREYNGVKGERLRTVRLRGQLSQGLLLPFTTAMAIKIGAGPGSKFEDYLDTDVTDFLGIQKWEAPIPAQLSGLIRGNFPTAVPKTDQERIQNLKKELEDWKARGLAFECTEKLDGSSCTMYLDEDGEFHVCSRNLDLAYDENNSFWRMAIKYDVHNRLMTANLKQFAIQGELIGEGIQGNPYNIKGQDFYVFDMYDVYLGKYVSPEDRQGLITQLELKHVPTYVTNWKLNETDSVESLLKLAESKSELNSKTEREGIVFKCHEDPSVSFKVISNKFLLKGGN